MNVWNGPAKLLHWLVAALVLAQVALGLLAISAPLSPAKLSLFVWHKSLGVAILALMLLRLAWRLTHAAPTLPADTPPWERRAAQASHALLYALLFALPLSGWVIANASGIPFLVFWLWPLPQIVPVDKATADTAARAHLVLLLVFGALLALHVAAALRHHFVKRDDVLRRMLPIAVLALVMALPVQAAEWRSDAAQSRLDFNASFEGAPAPGVFKQFDVRLAFDGDAPASGRLEVTIRTGSADMASADINQAIAGPEWFDATRHPQATFQASELKRDGGRFVARGTLTLKGVQRAQEVPFTWSAQGDAATMEGEFSVQRSAFQIGTGEWLATSVIGPEVRVKFRVRLRRAS